MPDTPPLTPAQRSLRARIAAHESWARTADRSARTAPARAAFVRRFERQVDPDNVLDPAERSRRAEQAMRAFSARMALMASRARSRKAAERRAAPQPAADAIADALAAEVETPFDSDAADPGPGDPPRVDAAGDAA